MQPTLRELNLISHSQRELTRSEKLFCYNRWNVNWIAIAQLHSRRERRNKQLLITAEMSQLSVSDLTNWANSIGSYELISSDLLLYCWIIEYRTDSKTFRHKRAKKVSGVFPRRLSWQRDESASIVEIAFLSRDSFREQTTQLAETHKKVHWRTLSHFLATCSLAG